jgi:tetratricopeptide (TPR) repeat protein
MLRAEAAIRLRDEATAVKRVADIKRVRAQMAPWAKTFPPSYAAKWEAYGDSLLARAHAVANPSAAMHKKAIEALEKVKHLEASDTIAGPAWNRTTRELLGETLLGAGKAKEALVEFEEDLEARPNRAIALLGAARAATAAGEAEKARAHYAALAELWKDADADLSVLAEVRARAK